jgi:exonuclease III
MRGAPLVVGTLNINGLHRKKTDLGVLLQQTRCDVMALQEMLLRSSDWQLRLPGYHCFSAMGDLTA